MSKKYFDKRRNLEVTRGLVKSNIEQFSKDVESDSYVKEYIRAKEQLIPDVDYSDPANFVYYGSAEKYYENAFKRIYNQYPYDGSKAQKLKFYNDLTPFEQHIFDKLYPKRVGYVRIGGTSATKYDSAGVVSALTFGKTNTPEYITFYGGPTTGSVYDVSLHRDNNLGFNIASGSGNTIEFWMRKDNFVGSNSPREVIFDLWNGVSGSSNEDTPHTSEEDYGRVTVFVDNAAKGNIYVHIASGSYWQRVLGNSAYFTLDTKLTNIADKKWHHYAIVLDTSGSRHDHAVAKLYVDSKCTSREAKSDLSIFALSGTMQANIGALRTGYTNDVAAAGGTKLPSALGYGKLSGTLDEFRYWKTARTSEQVGRNYFTSIGGGTDSDDSKYTVANPVDLGVYFKFNEGITQDDGIDGLVLDYSGRISNGVWTGYSGAEPMRVERSAMEEAGVTTEEVPDPVMYSTHPDVVTASTNLGLSGSQYDLINVSSLYNSIPQWIREEDEVTGEDLSGLLQILGSYLDTLHGQIEELKKLKEPLYSTSGNKPIIFGSKLLNSVGFDTPEMFIQADVLEAIFSQDNKRVYENKIQDLKNLIYKNIYNNLAYINKSKGTEKAFRNLFRCFGVDDDIFKINIYGDNVEYKLEDTHEITTTKKNVIDFSGLNENEQNREAVIFQYPSASTDYGFITASNNHNIPLTVEAEIIFPKHPYISSVPDNIDKSSLFGCHSAYGNISNLSQDTAWPDAEAAGVMGTAQADQDFQVCAIRPNREQTYFKLESYSNYFPPLTSSLFPNSSSSIEHVYDNTKWNFAVRFRPENPTGSHVYPLNTLISASNPSVSTLEFYGICTHLGETVAEFSTSASLPANKARSFLTGSNKRFFIGAHRQDFTGTLITPTDVRFSGFRVWHDYLSDEEIKHHSYDTNNYGRLSPYENAFVYEGTSSIGKIYIPKIETLSLDWSFETITGSAADGKFTVLDQSSGSSYLKTETDAGTPGSKDARNRYETYSRIVKNNYPARGQHFSTSSSNVISLEFIPTARQLQPENSYSSDLVNILNRDDVIFTRESRPVKHFFSIEASTYEIVSRNILNFFASIKDFNNLIGQPVNRYRGRYKGLEKLRQIFFERVKNIPDVDKFVSLYKWVDNALDSVVANLIPASANASREVRSIVESHVLERNKYRHKVNFLREWSPDDIGYTSPVNPSPVPKDPRCPTGQYWHNDAEMCVEIDESEVGQLYKEDNLENTPDDVQYSPNNPDEYSVSMAGAVNASPIPTYQQMRPPPGSKNPNNQAKSPFWWKYFAERDRGELKTGNKSTNYTRAQLHLNRLQELKRNRAKPYQFHADIQTPYGAGSNNTNTDYPDYFISRIKDSAETEEGYLADGIHVQFLTRSATKFSKENFEPFVGAIVDNAKTASLVPRKYPMIAYNSNQYGGINNQDINGSRKYFGDERLAFNVYSSSVKEKGAQKQFSGFDYNFSIENLHEDSYAPHYDAPMQGPWTKQNVGGRFYRSPDNNLLVVNPANRVEGFNIELKPGMDKIIVRGPRVVNGAYTKDRAFGAWQRGPRRPVNIQNIKQNSPSGNYKETYEILQTTQDAHPTYFVSASGVNGLRQSFANRMMWTFDGTGLTVPDNEKMVRNFPLPDREHTGSSNAIFLTRFSSPGGAETMGEGFLDVETSQYSPYNALPWRNLSARKTLNEVYTRHTIDFGHDSVYGHGTASFHKVDRNTLQRPSPYAKKVSSRPVQNIDYMYDNMWVNHQIPRTDVQYSWLNRSWVMNLHENSSLTLGVASLDLPEHLKFESITSSVFTPMFGFDFSKNFINVSASTDEYGIGERSGKSVVFMPVDFVGTNFLIVGEVTGSDNVFRPTGSGPKYSENFYNLPEFNHGTIGMQLNAYLLNLNGPYGHPSWKQIRGGEHPIARYHKKINRHENIIGKHIDKFEQPPVTVKHKPVLQSYPEQNSTYKYSFGNEYNIFSPFIYDTKLNKLEDKNEKSGISPNYDNSLLYSLSASKWDSLLYSEMVWPREENTLKERIKTRKWDSFWTSPVKTAQSDTEYTASVQKRVTTTLTSSQNQELHISASKWPMDFRNLPNSDLSGELMRLMDSAQRKAYDYQEKYDWTNPGIDKPMPYFADMTQSMCRTENLVHRQAGTGAFHPSYSKFAKDIQLIGADYSLIPEFNMSEYVRHIAKQHNFNFFKDVYRYTHTGSVVDFYAEKNKYFETFVHSDPITHFEAVKEKYGEPTGIRYKFSGIKKLFLKEGFYPVQRTLQLAQEFSRSYSDTYKSSGGTFGQVGTPAAGKGTWQTGLRPFFAPGIMYNSIRAGMAVDYPVVDASAIARYRITQNKPELDPSAEEEIFLNRDVMRNMHPSGEWPQPKAAYTTRLPFEAIIEPEYYIKQTVLSHSYGPGLRVYDPYLNSTGTLDASDGVYELAAHNFFAESVNFFLDNSIASASSAQQDEWQFAQPSSSAGVKKWAMDIVMEKSSDFCVHNASYYWGHYPWVAHAPPYWKGRWHNQAATNHHVYGGQINVCSFEETVSMGQNRQVFRVTFDPEKIHDVDPEKFFAGKFTLNDILANSEFKFTNQTMDAPNGHQFDGSNLPESYWNTGSWCMMSITASVNLFNKSKDGRWNIGTKWETPVLNYAKTSGARVRGVWHNYGEIPSSSLEGITLYVRDPQPVVNQNLTSSLVKACKFNTKTQQIGKLAKQKVIREAVICKPFYIDPLTGNEEFFDIPLPMFEEAYNNVEKGKVKTSLENMIFSMKDEKYVFNPMEDFVRVRKGANKKLLTPADWKPIQVPHAQYIFEFSHILSREDLRKIWQGVMPEISVTAETENIQIEHSFAKGEFFCKEMLAYNKLTKIPLDIRWKIYKVKMKAADNYYEMISKTSDTVITEKREIDYSFNWPYDYCSLVELGKMETSLQFENNQAQIMQNKPNQAGLVSEDKKKTIYALSGSTSNNVAHLHEYSIDVDGDGVTLIATHPNTDKIYHSHIIKDGKVLSSQSECYPKCKEIYGYSGVAAHTHSLPTANPGHFVNAAGTGSMSSGGSY